MNNRILRDRELLDLIERLDATREILEIADAPEVHLQVLADNALRAATEYLAELREERLREPK
jgi:hypothetical protein